MSAGKEHQGKGQKGKKKGGAGQRRSEADRLSSKMAKLSLERSPLGRSPDWNPAKTYVVVLTLGLAEWADEDDPQWNRAEVLWDFFGQALVPEDNMLWLDEEESAACHLDEIAEFLADTEEGSLLIFYYAGHGHGEDGEFYFWHPDDDDDDDEEEDDDDDEEDEEEEEEEEGTSSMSLTQLMQEIEDQFWGSHVVIFSDCCFSGMVAKRVGATQSSLAYAAITSASEKELSTGEWTFTDCLLNGLRGDSDIDVDRNGMVSLGELADYVAKQMRAVNAQSSLSSHTPNFRMEMSIATSTQLKSRIPSAKEASSKKAKKDKRAKKGAREKKGKKSKNDDAADY